MDNSLSVEIITPERVVVSDEAEMVEAKGSLGEFGIMPGHIRYLTSIEIGEIRYTKDGNTRYLATSGGFAEVFDDKVTLLVDTAEFAEEIDVDRAKRAKDRAGTNLKDVSGEEEDYRRYELALMRAIARIGVAEKKL
ncbi:MAG: F0F1 ATP synthase subunit epsilon [Syntrophobacterales bacterium]|nr:F0F1 ATP synthase subunit epsilon [Syntrophobacterales bacterium]